MYVLGNRNDDVEQSGGWGQTSYDLDFRTGRQVGLRFPDVCVADGLNVTSAVITLTADETHSAPVTFTFHGHATGDAPAFNSTDRLRSLPATSATSQVAVPAWTTGTTYDHDVTAVVAELAARGDFNNCGAMAFIANSTGTRAAESYDVSASVAATLTVTTQAAPTADGPVAIDLTPRTPAGDSQTVDVVVRSDSSLAAISSTVTFNPQLTEVTGCEASEVGTTTCNIDPSGTVHFATIDQFGAIADGDKVGSLTYRPANLAAAGAGFTIPLRFRLQGNADTLEGAVNAAADADGVVLVQAGEPNPQRTLQIRGDVNCDTFVDVIDALFIAQFDAFVRVDEGSCPGVGFDAVAGDFNRDGYTDVIDALFISQCDALVDNGWCFPDTEAPSAFSAFIERREGDRLWVGWTESIDNVRLRSYEIYLDGNFVASVGPENRLHLIEGIVPGTTHQIVLFATDGFSNLSPQVEISSDLELEPAPPNDPPPPESVRITSEQPDSIALEFNLALLPEFPTWTVDLYNSSGELVETGFVTSELPTMSYFFLPSDDYLVEFYGQSLTFGTLAQQFRFTKTEVPLTAPAMSTEKLSDSSVKVEWFMAGDEPYAQPVVFDVLVNGTSVLASQTTARSLTLDYLTPGEEYAIQVVATDAAGWVGYSNIQRPVMAIVDTIPPSWQNPSITAFDHVTPGMAAVEWTGIYAFRDTPAGTISDLAGYSAYIRPSNSNQEWQHFYSGTGSAAEVTGYKGQRLTVGLPYSVKVIGHDSAGNVTSQALLHTNVVASDPSPGGIEPTVSTQQLDSPEDSADFGVDYGENDAGGSLPIAFLGPADDLPPVCPTDPQLQVDDWAMNSTAKVKFDMANAHDQAPTDGGGIFTNGVTFVLRGQFSVPDGRYSNIVEEEIESFYYPRTTVLVPEGVRLWKGVLVRGKLPLWRTHRINLYVSDGALEVLCDSVQFRLPLTTPGLPSPGEEVCGKFEIGLLTRDLREECWTYYDRVLTDDRIQGQRVARLLEAGEMTAEDGFFVVCALLGLNSALGLACSVSAKDFIDRASTAAHTWEDLRDSRKTSCAIERPKVTNDGGGNPFALIFGQAYSETVLDWSHQYSEVQGGTPAPSTAGAGQFTRIDSIGKHEDHYNPICNTSQEIGPLVEIDAYLLAEYCPDNPGKSYVYGSTTVEC